MKYEQPFGVSDPNASYVNGNPATGTMGSIPPAPSIENPQREIVNFITDARLTPTDADLHQLGEAVQSNGVVYCDDQGTVNQLVITLAPPVTHLVKGMVFIVKSSIANTGPSTLKVNSLAPVPIVRSTDQAPLQLGDIAANCLQAYGFDGTSFQMVWSQRQANAPIFLTAPRTYYVNVTTGSDSFDGTQATVGSGIHGPFKTIQKACDQIPLYNLNGYNVTINVADGTYAAFRLLTQNGAGTIFLTGNPANPGNVLVVSSTASAMNIRNGYYCVINGFRVSTSGAPTPGDPMAGVWAQQGGTWALMEAMDFGPCSGPHIYSQFNAWAANYNPHSPWKISGGAQCFVEAAGASFGSNAYAGPDVTISAPVSFSIAFVFAEWSAQLGLIFGNLVGAANVTGARFASYYNSTISSGGGGINYFPGTIAGNTGFGGYYT